MNVTFYNFTKRRNSTKIPTSTGTVKTCKLKGDCSVMNPVILLAGSPVMYDYVHITAWSRYYFVTDIVSLTNGTTEYHLKEDVLASNKTAIGSTVANIAYASDYYSDWIVDPRIKVSTSKTVSTPQVSSNIFNADFYLVTIFDQDSTNNVFGCATTYYMSQSDLEVFSDFLSDSNVMSALSTYFGGDPMNAIFSIRYIPYSIPNNRLVTVASMTIAGKQFTRSLKYVASWGYKSDTITFDKSITYPSDFRRCEPYTTGILFLPGVGNVTINLSDFVSSDKIYVYYSIEYVTGNVIYFINTQGGNTVKTITAMMATDVPFGRGTMNVPSTVNSIGGIAAGVGGVLAGALTGNLMAGARGAGAALASVSNMALSSNQRDNSISGGIGGRGLAAVPYLMYTEFAVVTEDPNDADWIAKMGRPVAHMNTISTHSGYVQCIDAHVALNATEEEMSEVDNFLNSGIYYE